MINFNITDRALKKFDNLFAEADAKTKTIRIDLIKEGDFTVTCEVYSIDDEDHNGDDDLYINYNDLLVCINKLKSKYFDGITLDYKEIENVFIFHRIQA